ncbi:MAG TPA: ribonuclease H family protein [Candidatus Absconditabacterales bacterium]|nr:ribonuclease H family protein [Candidatus Absconditabacterales bacterium]HOQ79229.1 ribonuclease H family protein [Candidatus Absconditabacterales bacterium]HPK27757.1 ribonuclease H family protein [Candidatus Absconditabacterales bacterium]
MKYYVVREGLKRGIFTSRDECKNFVVGVKGARYKSFNSLTEAETALEKGFEPYYTKEKWFEKDIPFEKNSIAVDAACSRNPGITEYQGIDLVSGETIFHTKLGEGTNNIGEFLALVHGLSYLKKNNSDKAIYSDSKRAIKRVSEGKCKTNLKKTPDNAKIFDLIKRAEDWLAKNKFDTKILKRDTEERGEIPADFGRK